MTQNRPNLGQMFDSTAYIQHICCRAKTGPIFAFLVLKLVQVFSWFFENLVLPAKRRGFFKKKETKNDPILVLKTGPILLRNILGPVFKASLDQTPIFTVLFSKNAKFKETQKEKRHYL